MEIKYIIFIGFLLLVVRSAIAQEPELRSMLCGKTWYPEKYRETDGKICPLEAQYKAQYVRFDCDGKYESVEDGGVVLSGTWKLDAASKNVITTQTGNKKFPSKDTTAIVSCSANELVIKKQDGGGAWVFIYFLPR